MQNQTYKFEIMPLPYAYDALEPFIDALTMHIHHDRHLKTYTDNLNAALADFREYHNWTLERLLCGINCLPEQIKTAVKHNAGGVYNHEFFFSNMTGNGKKQPSGSLANEINNIFGSYDNFKQKFKEAALGVFGSGYAWLAADKRRSLRIITSVNQEVPITAGFSPVMCIDVWEHAYYLKHYNKRADYIDEWFNVINTETAEENFLNIYV